MMLKCHVPVVKVMFLDKRKRSYRVYVSCCKSIVKEFQCKQFLNFIPANTFNQFCFTKACE